MRPRVTPCLPAFLALSLGLHALVVAPAVIDSVRVPPPPAEPVEQAMIELLPEEILGAMTETASPGDQGGAEPTQAGSAEPSTSPPTAPETPAPDAGEPALRLAALSIPQPRPAESSAPTAAASPGAISISLTGTDSASNALVSGASVIPASPNDAKRNRPPVYPPDAARRRQTGRVVVSIQVTPMGLPGRADIVSGSGVDSLDRSAVEAVMTWRFRPAIRDGRAVAGEMVMEFIFTDREN